MGLSIRKLIGSFYKSREWKEIEYFDEKWKSRILQMSRYILANDSVVDYGCGKMWLKEFLSPETKYTGVDYQKRDEKTIVCDFNKREFPKVKSSIAFISGCLEYVEDPDWFLSQVADFHQKCILSYCSLDHFSDYRQRKNLGWKNHLKSEQLISLFEKKGMTLKKQEATLTKNELFYFEK